MHIAIVGAGLSGLAAAHELNTLGHTTTVFEASTVPGGRVRTKSIDGHLVDSGFQIFLTGYPQAQYFLSYPRLNLKEFSSGAVVRKDNEFHRVSDPLRDPKNFFNTIKTPIGSPLDKAKLLKLRQQVLNGSLKDLWSKTETSTLQMLKNLNFSDSMIEDFLQPLFAGITLDPKLTGSSRKAEFVYRMLATGKAAVPTNGMGEIPKQLAESLPAGSLILDFPVVSVTAKSVASGNKVHEADAVIVATDQSQATTWIPEIKNKGWKSVTSVWFKAPEAPLPDKSIILNSGEYSVINNAAVMSNISNRYAPPGGSATVVASTPVIEPESVAAISAELKSWFGAVFDLWEILEVQEIEKAQPLLPIGTRRKGYLQSSNGIWACGDYLTDSSINGALESGRKTAQAVVRN